MPNRPSRTLATLAATFWARMRETGDPLLDGDVPPR
jgi:hypothetical protein